VVAKVRDRLPVSKQTMHKFHMERFNLKKLNEVESKEQYQVQISNRFTPLENLDDDMETIIGNINISAKESIGYYELRKHKLWFDKRCSTIRLKEKSQTAIFTGS
jgi:hypothetical protein